MCGYRVGGCEWIIARYVSAQCMGFSVFIIVFNGCHWEPCQQAGLKWGMTQGWTQGSRPANKQQHKPAGVTERISFRGPSSCLTGHTITSHLMFWNSKGFSVHFLSGWCEKLYSSVEVFQFIDCYLPNQQSDRLFLILLFRCSASQGHRVTRKGIIMIFFRGCGVISC